MGGNEPAPSDSATAIKPILTRVAFLRPMYCDSTPSGKRISVPATMGINSIKLLCAGVSS